MSTLTMPSVSITFSEAASTAIARSQKGVVALILRDAALAGKTYSLASSKQIPTALGVANQAAVKRAFLGYVNPPQKVLLYVLAADGVIAADSAALTWLATQSFDYLAGPADLSEAEATVLKTWTVAQRTNNHAIYKSVLPNMAADDPAIINVTTNGSKVGTDTFDAAAYCGRVAGLLAGTPMTVSATFAPMSEVEDVERLTQTEMDTAVGAGKFLWWWDGEKVKTGRAVNSFQTTTVTRGDDWKYIKIVELLDMIDHDLRKAAQDSYIGKYSNIYDNKQLLVSAIQDYLQTLADGGLIESGFTCGIDVDAQEVYLQSQGTDTRSMTEQEIKQANTGTQVFIAVTIKPINAIEDIKMAVTM